MTRGFFVEPSGQLVLVRDSHIGALIDAPERFGLTLAVIAEAHARHGEALRTEGRARNELLTEVLRRAPWVRVREQVLGAYRWHLQLAPTLAGWRNVQRFAELALAGLHPAFGSPEWPTTLVQVLGLGDGVLWSGRLGSLQLAPCPFEVGAAT